MMGRHKDIKTEKQKDKKTKKRKTIRTENSWFWIFSFFCFFVFLFFRFSNGYAAQEESPLFWPPPPAEMRVVFVQSVYTPLDAGIKPGFLKKLKGFIFGGFRDVLNKPLSVAVDRQKTIYVCDTGEPAVHIFSVKEKRHKKISAIGKEELVSPVAVGVSADGLIFIADSSLRKVFCLDKQLKPRFVIGGQADKFLRPAGLAISGEKLYVTDTLGHCIYVYDLAGRLLEAFGRRGKGKAEFNFPTALCVDRQGRIYVVDTLNFRIQVFDAGHKFLYSIGQLGDGSGSFSRPKGVAVDSFGHIYVSDAMFDNLQIFNQSKEFLLSLGEAGHKAGEFWIPGGLAIDQDDYIYAADSYNQRVQIFRYVGKE